MSEVHVIMEMCDLSTTLTDKGSAIKRTESLLNTKKEKKKTPKMGYSRSRARCVPLQYPSSATRGVKQALNKKPLNQNIILSSPLQEKKSISEKGLNSFEKESTDPVSQSESGMFYELSNRKRMECEKYQDCSWFQQSPLKLEGNGKLSPAETFDPFFDADEFDLPMPYAQPSPWGDEYLEVFTDDIPLGENYKSGEKNKSYISDENIFINYKGDENNAFDSCNINFSLKKTDSIDSMKNISLTNPAEVIPISYKERLSNSNYGLTKLGDVKSEIKQEVDSCSSESDSYLMDSDDNDLNIGREEVVEEMNCTEDLPVVNKKEVETSHQVKCEVQTDKISEYALNNKNNGAKDIKNDGNNFNQVPLPVKSEFMKSNNQPTAGKLDFNLDISKINFEQSLNVNTPDLDFMDLVEFINAEMRQENVNPTSCTQTQTSVCQNPTNQDVVSTEEQTNAENVEEKDAKMSSTACVDSVWSTDGKDNSTVDFNEVASGGVSIAERIKTSAKRRTRTNVKDLIESDDEESCESMDDDEDYDYTEDLVKRRCSPIKRRTKSSLSESSSDGKRMREEDSSYRERRDKNNEASRRSRQNRKARERHMYETLEEEEKKNVKLKAEAEVLDKQVTSLRQLLLQVVLRKGGAT